MDSYADVAAVSECSTGLSQVPERIQPNGFAVRTRDGITAHFDLMSERQLTLIDRNRSAATYLSLSIDELDSIVKFVKTERAKLKKEYTKYAKNSLKNIQSL